MKRNKTGEMPEITRTTYKGVKKMDHQQLAGFCKDLYGFGFEDGRASVPGVDVEDIIKVIGETKGIGPKKLEEIRRNIEALYPEEAKA